MTIPRSTYRLQLSADFGFDAAAALVPYLKALGISHLYTSPILKARAGSKHGYDIVDHHTLNPEYGGETAFLRLCEALKQAGMELIIDFVPNHMGVGYADNAWWLDVLEWGPRSPHAASFDIDWDALPFRQSAALLLPILGRPYGDALNAGEIDLKYDPHEGSFSAWYFNHRMPISPYRYSEILKTVVQTAGAESTSAGRALLALAQRYSGPRNPSPKDAPAFKHALATLEGAAELIACGLATYRSHAGLPVLHRLLERQHYRLAYWRVAVSAINYRRFFDINDLAGIRIEDPRTFRAVHEFVARLIAEDRVQGLRIDHIDGLRDPLQYNRRLRQLVRSANPRKGSFYVVVEKILAEGERMPKFAGVAGTTGYEILNTISRVLVASEGLPRLESAWREFSGNNRSFEEILERSKLVVLDSMLASEFSVLGNMLARIAAGHYSTRDYTLDRLRAALQLVVLAFPIYRTYVTSSGPSPEDRKTIEYAIEAARARWRGPDPQIFDFIRDALTLDLIGKGETHYSRPRVRRFALKMQQFTGPMMAKSLEDTAFYQYHRLLALNEVGGEPTAGGLTPEQFHAVMMERAARRPHALTATATHDTKRGEDARDRLLALAEIPDEWAASVQEWHRLNARFAGRTPQGRSPSLDHEYMLYQSLLGAWPLGGPDDTDDTFVARITEYVVKAAREGKIETSWNNVNEQYEKGLTSFVRRMLDRTQSAAFVESFDAMARRVAFIGALNSLVQLTLKATLPGVPDFYQGTELWDLSLVDPDNRRAVDFSALSGMLHSLETPDWNALIASWPDGRIKMALTARLLRLRNEFSSVFLNGSYQPIEIGGADRDHVLAFTRSAGQVTILVAVGRHFASQARGSRPYDWDIEIQTAGDREMTDLLNNSPSISGRFFDSLPLRIWRVGVSGNQPSPSRKMELAT